MDKIEAQNILMTIPNREIAISMITLSKLDRDYILSFVSPGKHSKIVDELELQNRLQITYKQIKSVSDNIYLRLQKINKKDLNSYLRPLKKNRKYK